MSEQTAVEAARIDVGYVMRDAASRDDEPMPVGPPSVETEAWMLRQGIIIGMCVDARRIAEADALDPDRTNALLGDHLVNYVVDYSLTVTEAVLQARLDAGRDAGWRTPA